MKPLRYVRTHPIITGLFALILALFVVVRVYMNGWVLHYVNQVLGNIQGYQGSVESIDIHLYRGAYQLHNLKIMKTGGHIPTPFVAIDTADISIEWSALIHGRIVSNVDLVHPVINFAVGPNGGQKQTGKDVDWTKPIKDLAPVDINRVSFTDGKLTYQDFSTSPQVNIYINHMAGSVHNLRNVVDAAEPMPSTIEVTGDSIGNGALKLEGRMNILKPVPDIDIRTQLENVHLPALSNYSDAYAAIDIKDGTLNVYAEVIVKDNQVSGYIKPIATHVSLIDLHKTNPLKLAWQSSAAAVLQLFTNLSNDQFATKIPLQGNLDHIDTDTWTTIGGIIRNAFVSAFKKGLESNPLHS